MEHILLTKLDFISSWPVFQISLQVRPSPPRKNLWRKNFYRSDDLHVAQTTAHQSTEGTQIILFV